MNLSFQSVSIERVKADISIAFINENEELFRARTARLNTLTGRQLAPAVAAGDFRGKDGEIAIVYPASSLPWKRLVVAGLGDSKTITLEKLRKAAALAIKAARKYHPASVAVEMIDFQETRRVLRCSYSDAVQALVEGASLSMYAFDKYFTSKEMKTKKISSLILFDPDRRLRKEGEQGVRVAAILRDAVFRARDLENAPSNEITPDTLARSARLSARTYGYSARVFDARKIASLGMGGLIAVNQGSAKPPRFIVLEYGRGKPRADTVVLVGKGITFDSGGISIKPSAGMSEMKMDMSGAAAVIGTLEACARLRLSIHLIGLVPATENMPGSRAVKPGDIIRQYNGKTTEIDNTDAEGRLILADALGYASLFKPKAVIDLATLTGACVVALGHHATGMMGTSDEVMNRLTAAGERTYERVWRLPLFDEYDRYIKSDVADVKNVGGRWGGAITAGMFLKKFIGNYPWVHLDIAGTAMSEEQFEYIPKGGTGVGVRMLIDMLRNWRRLG